MSNLISGKNAWLAMQEGKEVQYRLITSDWFDLTYEEFLNWQTERFLLSNIGYMFRLKPKTILINGVEVPAPFKPKHGDVFWHIDVREICSYNHKQEWSDSDEFLQLGAWRTEDEIKQVVEALRKVFNHE